MDFKQQVDFIPGSQSEIKNLKSTISLLSKENQDLKSRLHAVYQALDGLNFQHEPCSMALRLVDPVSNTVEEASSGVSSHEDCVANTIEEATVSVPCHEDPVANLVEEASFAAPRQADPMPNLAEKASLAFVDKAGNSPTESGPQEDDDVFPTEVVLRRGRAAALVATHNKDADQADVGDAKLFEMLRKSVLAIDKDNVKGIRAIWKEIEQQQKFDRPMQPKPELKEKVPKNSQVEDEPARKAEIARQRFLKADEKARNADKTRHESKRVLKQELMRTIRASFKGSIEIDSDPESSTNADSSADQDNHDKAKVETRPKSISSHSKSQSNEAAIIFDNGSGMFKAGFAGNESPMVTFPSVIGTSKYGPANKLVGNHAYEKKSAYALEYPIKKCIPGNWDDVEMLWKYAYEELDVADPSEHPLLLTEATRNKSARQKMAEIMFEKYDVPSLFIAMPAWLRILITMEDLSGIAIDSGDGMTQIVPVYEGNSITSAISYGDVAGSELTEYMIRLLLSDGYNFNKTSAEREIARGIKEKCCRITALDAEEAKPNWSELVYELPDGQNITIHNQIAECPEALFNPELATFLPGHGLQEHLIESILRCDENVQQIMYNNILLTGGTMRFPGIKNRLMSYLQAFGVSNIVQDPNPLNSGWLGGSVVASMNTFDGMVVSRSEFMEIEIENSVEKFLN